MRTADAHKTIGPQSPSSSAASPHHHRSLHDKKYSANRDVVTVRQRPSNAQQQPSWFSALRSRLSQLTMPEWLSQLGIGASQAQHHHTNTNPNRHSVAVMPISEHIAEESSTLVPKKSAPNMGLATASPSATLAKICDRSAISLDTWDRDDESFDWGWSLDSSIWNGDGTYNDTLKVQHFGPLNNLTLERQEPGRGHEFLETSMSHPTWCDKCGDFMWGFLTCAVKCQNCNYTCHEKCKILVTLDCKIFDSSMKSNHDDSPPPALYPNLQVMLSNGAEEQTDSGNKLQKELPLGSSEPEKSFSGLIQIHMNFTRPINVVAGETFPSMFDVVNTTGSTTAARTITTFFLPRNTVKTVNIGSEMTTREMIVTLLRKFKVADNPRKFALYERVCDNDGSDAGQDGTDTLGQLLRVPDEAHPLRIARSWHLLNQSRQFVLQENDTGDILWEMFEVPELENFLRILAIEEKQYGFRIRQKYNAYMYSLEEQLRYRGYDANGNPNLEGTPV